jgi:hypothetical protein
MRKQILKTLREPKPVAIGLFSGLASATLLFALSGVPAAAHDSDVCGDHTLKGKYAFTVEGQTANGTGRRA